MTNEDKLRKREDRLLRQHRSYYNAYAGAVFFFFMTIVAPVIINAGVPEDLRSSDYLINMLLFWGAIAFYAKAKVRHIESIKHYREKFTL